MSARPDVLPRAQVVLFVRTFAGLWLAYDVLDVAVHGTAAISGAYASRGATWLLLALQLALIGSELAALLLRRPFRALGAMAAARAAEAIFSFHLNDFFSCALTAAILAQLAEESPGYFRAWPREVLRWQTAWIYLATALLKLNTGWLSGGNLLVRHRYLETVQGWPYPEIYRRWAFGPPGSACLAWAGLLAEVTLALLLAIGARRRWTVAIAVCIHAFGALAMNVWFFGAAMVLQVAFVSDGRARGVRS